MGGLAPLASCYGSSLGSNPDISQVSNIQNIRCKHRSGQHTLAYQKNILKHIRTCSSVVWTASYFVFSAGVLFWEHPTENGLCNLQESLLYATISIRLLPFE
jgi:hypothetical protein